MVQLDFINVGYGDAILLRWTDGQKRAVLVDCGDVEAHVRPGSGARVTAAEFLRRAGVERLDILWLTHLHLDHVGGLEELMGAVSVERLVTGYLPAETLAGSRAAVLPDAPEGVRNLLQGLDVYSRCLARLKAQKTTLTLLGPGAPLQPVSAFGLTLTPYCTPDAALFAFQQRTLDAALSGEPDVSALERLDLCINDLSVGLRVSDGTHAAELPGDMGLPLCEQLLTKPCDVLKVSHHGHRGALSRRLMETLRPALTVISVSDDRTDDCPARETILLAQAASREVRFTDRVCWNGQALACASVPFTGSMSIVGVESKLR